MDRRPAKTKDVTCRDLALRACRELLVAAESRPTAPNVSRAIVLAKYALAMRP